MNRIFMALFNILPRSDTTLNSYHQKLSWKISEESWKSEDFLVLHLKTKIPGSSSNLPMLMGWPNPYSAGGYVLFGKRGVVFITEWPKDVDHINKIRLDVIINIKVADGSTVVIQFEKTIRKDGAVHTEKMFNLDPEPLYDLDRCFIIEAELKVTQIETNEEDGSKKLDVFVKDIESIFHDKKTSDVLVIAENEKFYCHKNILSARCEVFKNMLATDTIESDSNIIEMKEVTAEAVDTMLKYIYTGQVPGYSEKLTLDLLKVADMYLLDHLKEACLKSLLEKLEVSSCIPTFIMADRYIPSSGYLREMVIRFMKCKAELVVETEDWDKLVDAHPALAKELMRAMVKGGKEKHKCRFCVVSYDK